MASYQPSDCPPVKLTPVAVPRLWGGHQLKAWFDVTTAEPVGEYWLVSAHPHGLSRVTDGPLAGHTLADLVQQFPAAYLGNSPQPRFPLLIKLIEAAADLSVQVHPDDEYARQHAGDFGKTEAWYVLHCPPDGQVIYGHRFASRQEFLHAVVTHNLANGLCKVPIAPGQLVYVPAGTLHALLAGTIVLEVQQTSDVTYRVYDWDRLDPHGQPRTLHIDEAADVLQYGPQPHPLPTPEPLPPASGREGMRLLTCAYFTLEHWHVTPGLSSWLHGRPGNPDVVVVLNGRGWLSWPQGEMQLQRGDAVLIPATLPAWTVNSLEEMEWIRVYY
ncbi:MAG: class I mannose-6-phosphate isomerase [Alicyclobacillus sp.]|nr:class I mannose-6-phosphate isomerase [Alicyclobacillus sp.]